MTHHSDSSAEYALHQTDANRFRKLRSAISVAVPMARRTDSEVPKMMRAMALP